MDPFLCLHPPPPPPSRCSQPSPGGSFLRSLQRARPRQHGYCPGSALACSALSNSPVCAFKENPSSSRSSSRLVWSLLTSDIRRERSETSSVDWAQTFRPPSPSRLFQPYSVCLLSAQVVILAAQAQKLARTTHTSKHASQGGGRVGEVSRSSIKRALKNPPKT